MNFYDFYKSWALHCSLFKNRKLMRFIMLIMCDDEIWYDIFDRINVASLILLDKIVDLTFFERIFANVSLKTAKTSSWAKSKKECIAFRIQIFNSVSIILTYRKTLKKNLYFITSWHMNSCRFVRRQRTCFNF